MREEKKRKAMDDGKSERASSTDEAGEPSRGTLSREGARRVAEPLEGKAPEQRAPISVATKLERIAMRARERPQEVITSLNHFIDVEWLRTAHARTRKDGAVGVDGMTSQQYEAKLEENLATLLTRFKTKTYRAPPVKRVHIPKGDGSKTRPIGIPTFEDKVLQRAVAMCLEAIYEQEFRDCSYGFRPRRSQHDALKVLKKRLKKMDGGFVIEIDIEKFFDSLDHDYLRSFLDLRVRDGVIRQAIGSWLKAGVLEDGCLEHPEEGTPQGGVISPLLANIFLHHVLDVWFEDEIAPRLSGESFLVRFADDAVIVCKNEEDARRVMSVLPKRFGKYGLTLHPEKTRLVRFKRPRYRTPGKGRDDDDETPGTFSFLGFNHHWEKLENGIRIVRQTTDPKRIQKALKRIAEWCKAHRHLPVREQRDALARKLRGHDAYYGVTGNYRALKILRFLVARVWRHWLNRRSQHKDLSWARFKELLIRCPLPRPHIAARTS
jgi:RNA-directed DNA polymerase